MWLGVFEIVYLDGQSKKNWHFLNSNKSIAQNWLKKITSAEKIRLNNFVYFFKLASKLGFLKDPFDLIKKIEAKYQNR